MEIPGRKLFYICFEILVKNFRKVIVDMSSSQKIAQFQKRNGLNRSSDVGDIADLKSVIF